MDALSMLKFWKISSAKVAGAANSDGDGPDSAFFDDCPAVMEPLEDETDSEAEYEEDEEDDSFFEMEFTLPDYSDSKSEPKINEQNDAKLTRIGDLVSSMSRSPLASKSRDKTRPKPQSPISILKSAPKLRVSMFGKLKKSSTTTTSTITTTTTEEADKRATAANSSPINSQPKSGGNNLFIKFRIEDASTTAKRFGRTGSSKPTMSTANSVIKSEDLVDVSSKRFSKESVQKYLNLIKKPMYVKVAAVAISKRSGSKLSSVSETQQQQFNTTTSRKPCASPIASPRRSEEKLSNRLRAPLKNLGKSRSGNALIGSPSSSATNKKDDSLVQQNDGIEGAILHCKQSLKCSEFQERRSSLLSRCSSDPSSEKSLVKKAIQ